jgi:hypothetical protein
MHEITLTQKDAMIFTSITTFDLVVERITTQLSPPFTFEHKEKEDKKFTLIPWVKAW